MTNYHFNVVKTIIIYISLFILRNFLYLQIRYTNVHDHHSICISQSIRIILVDIFVQTFIVVIFSKMNKIIITHYF